MMGPYARAYCFFANIGKKFMNRPGGIPLSLSGRLPNWVYYMYKRPRDPNCVYCMYWTFGASTAGTRPGMLPRWVEVLLCDFYTPDGGDMGSK